MTKFFNDADNTNEFYVTPRPARDYMRRPTALAIDVRGGIIEAVCLRVQATAGGVQILKMV